MPPDVSVVIPTHNRRSFLPETIESCFEGNGALDVEVIVVDDGSTDGTQAWMEALNDGRVVYLRQENEGAPVARNRGKEAARGRYLKFLDDDDHLMKGGLVEEVNVLEETGADICCGNLYAEQPTSEDFVFETDPSPDLAAGIFGRDVVTYPHVFLYRRKKIEDVQWDPTLRHHQDLDFAVRVASMGVHVVSLDQVVGIWNDHEGDRIKTRRKDGSNLAQMIRHRISIVEMGLERLEEHGALRPHHRDAAAHGIWQWAHMISSADFQCFEECMRSIQNISPGFSPPRSSAPLAVMDRVFGPSVTEKLLSTPRRAKQHFSA